MKIIQCKIESYLFTYLCEFFIIFVFSISLDAAPPWTQAIILIYTYKYIYKHAINIYENVNITTHFDILAAYL